MLRNPWKIWHVRFSEWWVRNIISIGAAYSQNISKFSCFEVWTVLLVVGVSCSPKWTCDLSRCYYASRPNVKVDQSTARDDCHSENAELASITDSTEYNFVKSIWSVY